MYAFVSLSLSSLTLFLSLCVCVCVPRRELAPFAAPVAFDVPVRVCVRVCVRPRALIFAVHFCACVRTHRLLLLSLSSEPGEVLCVSFGRLSVSVCVCSLKPPGRRRHACVCLTVSLLFSIRVCVTLSLLVGVDLVLPDRHPHTSVRHLHCSQPLMNLIPQVDVRHFHSIEQASSAVVPY